MLIKRIMPCLLLDGERLVKTTKFSKGCYVGDPINAVKIFNEKEVDELVILNISQNRGLDSVVFSLISEIVSEAFMPITYGGGIRAIEDVGMLFRLGVEKVSFRSAIFDYPDLLNEVASCYGAQALSLCIDVKKDIWGRYMAGVCDRKKSKYLPLKDMLTKVSGINYGELIVNNVDRDGTLLGLDHDLISTVSKNVTKPLVVVGGAHSLADIKDGFTSGADAVAAGSLFVYSGAHRAVLLSYPTQTEIVKYFEG